MPDASTLRVVVEPLLMVMEAGWLVMAGAVTLATNKLAVCESADPAALLARTQ